MSYTNYFAQDCLKYVHSYNLPTQKVLIVGCGKGLDCAEFTMFTEIHGLDLCHNLGRDFSHPNVSYYQESAEKMQRASNSYDLVFSVATLEHIHHLEAAFSEMQRVAKPGGLIYCLAAPLWHCLEGHHLNYYGLFSEFPWIHLRLSPDEILQYIQEYKQVSDLETWIDLLQQEHLLSMPLVRGDLKSYAENLVNFMFSDYFNRLPAKEYVKAAESLKVSRVLRNDFWYDGETLLTPAILQELTAKGLTREELLAVSHTYIAIK